MNYLLYVVLLLVAVYLAANVLRNRSVKKMTPQQVKEIIGQKNVFLIDVRSPGEFSSGHIKGAKNVPLQLIQQGGASQKIKDKNAKVIVYCQSGSRSMIAYHLLKREGYDDLFDMGSIMKWPYEIV